jgi:hypothetical protein
MDDAIEPPDLTRLMQKILVESNQYVKEISPYRLKSILKERFGVKPKLKTIEKTLRDSRWMLTLGWGRGENYLYRIPRDIEAPRLFHKERGGTHADPMTEGMTQKEKGTQWIKSLKK